MDKVTEAGIYPRLVPHDVALQAAKNFIDAHFNNPDGKGVLTGIPAHPDHDDLLLTDYIKQQRALDRPDPPPPRLECNWCHQADCKCRLWMAIISAIFITAAAFALGRIFAMRIQI